MKLRDYQLAAINDILASWDSGNIRTLLTVPTGGGKTVIASKLIEVIIGSGGRVLLFVNRLELLSQTARTLQRTGINPSIITSDCIQIGSQKIYIAMQATLRNRLKRRQYSEYFQGFTHLIIDECHYGDFRWVFSHEAFKNIKILGLTATPISAKKDMPLRDIYQNIIEPVTVKDLIAEGSLVSARHFSVKRDLSKLTVKGGEFTESSQEAVFAGKALYEDVVNKYKEFCAGRKCIVFNTTQRMAVEMALAFNEAGIKSDYLISGNDEHDGVTDERRRRILEDFQNGDLMVISNTAILTAGFDAPICSAIILNYATMQRAKYVQCIGRGARPFSGKKDFVVVDIGENNYRFGLFDMMWERKGKISRLINSWSELFWNPYAPKSESLPPVKDCPHCNAMLPAQVRVCSVCGHVFSNKREQHALQEFAEVKVEKSPEQMIKDWIWVARHKDVGGENFVLKKIRENLGVSGLYLYAEIAGREKNWADSYYRSRKERLWSDIKRTFPIRQVQDFIAEDIRKQLASKVDFFKIEIAYREKVLAYPDEFLKKYFVVDNV